MPRSLCSISSIRYALGSLLDIATIPALKASPTLLQDMRLKGFRTFSRSDQTPPLLAQECASRTLAASPVPVRDIDAVIFATNSMWHEEFYTLPAVHNVLVELGMEQAELTGLFLSGCANSVDALRVAANMIHAEGRKAVLVLLADAVEPINGERILTGDYAIMGDAAVSFVVQPPGAGELDVVGLSKKSNARLGSLTLGSAEYVFGALAGMRMALDEACKQAGVSVDEISRAYMSNLDLKLCHSSMWALGIGGDRWSARGVSEYGHCFASDTFLNFVVQGEDEPVLSDSCVLLYSQSIACWGSTILRTRRGWPRS